MSENTNNIDWTKIFAIIAAGFIVIMAMVAIIWEIIQSKPSCGFVRLKISDAQALLSAYQDDQLADNAKATCPPEDLWGCYNEMVRGNAGGGFSAPMATSWDDCKIYYDPYRIGFTFPLETDVDVGASYDLFMQERGGMGIDDALTAFFYGILAHERRHQQQCVEGGGKPETFDESRQDEIEAYPVFIQYMQDQLTAMGCNENSYCPCIDPDRGKPKRYSSYAECLAECPSLKCPGVQCTAPP